MGRGSAHQTIRYIDHYSTVRPYIGPLPAGGDHSPLSTHRSVPECWSDGVMQQRFSQREGIPPGRAGTDDV